MVDFKDSLYKIIGERIKTRREILKITQSELSKILDLSRASVSNIEVGRHQIPLFVLYDLSSILKLDIKELIPSYDEVVLYMSNKIVDFSSHIDKNKFNDDELDSIKDILKNI